MSTTKDTALPVVRLEIDANGGLSKKMPAMDRDSQLENTLIEALYPGIRVATVDVPSYPLDQFEQARVEQALTKLDVDGVRYRLVGASGSAKSGKYYAVDAPFEKKVAERFRHWPEAAITYFGILVSPCKVRIEIPDCRLMVVEDCQLGTNDCRGWIRRSLFERLDQPAGRFYQFRLSFEKTQAKGSFKVMEDDVAEKLDADVILPESSVKPEYKGTPRIIRWLTGSVRTFRGPVVLGIREVSRDLEFESSYSLVEHAPADSIELEIKPYALEQVRKVTAAVEEGDFTELFRLLGTSESQRVLRRDEEVSEEPAYTSTENTIVEAVLKADPTGHLVKHPFINKQLQRTLARWAFKMCTAGGFRLPAFALADDGFLILDDGQVYAGSDWMPEDHGIISLGSSKFLCVRYPIRTKEDLLPVTTLNASDTVSLLTDHLRSIGCSMSERQIVDQVVVKQLRLEGTLTLHSGTARKNGGDYDFDWVCVLEGARFPRFVESRFAYREQQSHKKKKLKKKQSPWWNLPQVALQAKGNQIGSITDLKTSCLAAGQPELAYRLAKELQAALDQLKHGVEPDREVIAEIRKQVPKAPWLNFKRKERISDLPLHVDVPPSDSIGQLYNFIRKEIQGFFSETRPLADYRGLIAGGEFDREMHRECGQVSRIYGFNVSQVIGKRKQYEDALEKAQAELEALKDDPKARRQAIFRRNQAQAALHFCQERSRQELRAMINFVRKWAERKTENRLGWLQALHMITCNGNGQSTGSIEFYAFPQEIVDKIVERTGGRPVVVEVPELCDGEVEIDLEGRVFLVDRFSDASGHVCERQIFLMQVNPKGEVYMDVVRGEERVRIRRIRPFSFEAGRSEVQNGRLMFPGTRQRPEVPKAKLD